MAPGDEVWTSDLYRNQISVLGLVASDASYKPGGFGDNTLLQTSPDNSQQDEYPFYPGLLERLGISDDPSARLAYEAKEFSGSDSTLVAGVEFKNWYQFGEAVEVPRTGGAAVLYRRSYVEGTQDKYEYIIAFRGTDGINGQDWFSNILVGRNQWQGLVTALFGPNGQIPLAVNPDGSPARVHFTGQSLGGALAQYAAYEYVRQRETSGSALFNAEFASKRGELVTLTTFNAFAGGAGLARLYDGKDGRENYEPFRLAGVPTAHYSIENEIVHNVGGRFVGSDLQYGFLNATDGGASNLYHFASWRRWHDVKEGDQGYLGLIEGHRIESGFYQGLHRNSTTFSSAVQGGDPTGLIQIDRLQQVGEIFARFLGGERSSEVASWARVTAALSMGAVFGGVGDVARLLQLAGNSLYKSDHINFITKAVIASGIGSRLTASSLLLLAKPAIAIAGAASLVAAIADLFERGKGAPEATALLNNNLGDEKAVQLATVGVNDGTKGGGADSVRRFGLLTDYLQPELLDSTPLKHEKQAFEAINDDPVGFATTLYQSQSGYYDALAFLTNEANERAYAGDSRRTIEFARALADAGGNEATRIAGADTAVQVALASQIADYIGDVAAAVANLGGERLPGQGRDTSIVLAPVASYQDFRALVGKLKEEFEDFDSYALIGLSGEAAPVIAQKLDDARAALTAAGQAIEIRVFAEKPANPFDDPTFDPGADPAASNEVAGGSAGTYVVFLPYEATQGGQRIALKLEGAGADKVTVLSEGALVTVADGTFTLTVAEGRRQVAFVLGAADDLGASSSISVSATLVNENGVATHQTQVEANVALRHVEQSYGALFEVATAADFRSADRISGYFSVAGLQNDPTLVRTKLVGSDGGDFVIADHASESVVSGGGNDFIVEEAGSGSGTYVDADRIEGGAGNDFITGYLGSRVDAGAGDDFVNANFTVRLAASRESQTLAEFPAEIYADIASFLRVVPTGTGPVTNADGSLDFGYVRDFGNNNVGNPILGVSAKMGVVATEAGTQIERTASGGAAFQFTTFNGVANIAYLGAGAPVTYGVAFESSAALGNTDAVLISGGDGNDQLAGAGGFDFIGGGTGNDRIAGFGGDDTLEGEEGHDQIVAGGGDDYVDGGAGDDRLWGEGGHDGLWGGNGNDVIFGDAPSTPLALQGNDYLDGGAGNDQLIAGGGNDELFGGEGNDVLEAGDGDDYLDGEAGNDTLVGGAGDDELLGGEGTDTLSGGDGADVLRGESGIDQMDGGTGDDRLYGGQGNDHLSGGSDDDHLDGGAGADQLFGGAGADILQGGVGADRLAGGENADTLVGGAGDNLLAGDAGDDTYILALGDGLSIIDDPSGANRIVYGYGIFAEDVVAAYTDPATGPQDLVLTYGSSRASIRGGGSTIDSFAFADGTLLTRGQFLATNLAGTYERRSNVLIGTVGNDVLTDTSGADVVAYGLEGSDAITTGSGADSFHGGAGNDTLNGGVGNDAYHFSRGDGNDRITDVDPAPGNVDAVVYAGDIDPDEVSVTRSANDLVLILAGTGDRITVAGYFQNDGATPNALEQIRFLSDGTVWDVEAVKLKAIVGTAGADVLTGYATDDTIAGADGNDVLQGAGGADVLDGGGGDDTLRGGAGDDTYVFGRGYGTDVIDEENAASATSGLDTVVLAEDISPAQVRLRRITERNLELRLDDGAVLLVERQFALDGALAEPIERIQFASDGTVWDLQAIMQIIATPTPGDDFLWGTPGDDTLTGAGGDDWLRGGRGSDAYRFNIGDGNDLVHDTGAFLFGGEIDRIELGAGITPVNVAVSKQILFGVYPTLVLHLETGDSLSIVNYFGTSPVSTPDLIEQIRFDDGTVWTDETVAEHFPIFGTPVSETIGGSLIADVILAGDGSDIVTARSGHDVVYGGNGNDNLQGQDGDDRLYGEAGNDTLNGGVGWPRPGDNLLDGGPGDDLLDGRSAGRDLMLGGEGNDRYLFGFGSGIDTAEDRDAAPESVDSIVLGAGITPAQITGWHTASHRVLALNDHDQLHILWDPAAGFAIEQVQFADGTAWGAQALLEHTATPLLSNQPPALAEPLPDQIAFEDLAFSLTVPASTFVDTDADDTLAYGASRSDGSPLPAWLSFDPSAIVFSGTPAQDDVGSVEIAVRATDKSGLSTQDVFVLNVQPTNDTPALGMPMADQTAVEDEAFSLSLPGAMFTDVDPGDTLTLSASLSDGSALPAWLAFDPLTARFTGTPANGDVGEMTVRITATDAEGAVASDAFGLRVINVNDAPLVALELEDKSVDAEAPFAFAIPVDAFIDVDAEDSLAFSATQLDGSALPVWLHFEAGGGTFSGLAPASDIGIIGVAVRATDTGGETARSEFALTVRAVAGSSVSGGAGDDVIPGGDGDERLSGGAGDDALFGNEGDDTLQGGRGNDVLQGGTGDDVLRAGPGQSILDGGAGDDVIFDGLGDSFISGGRGNDIIRLGAGNDVLVFNQGDGWDTIAGGGDGGNTLSLGGGIDYGDLAFSRSGDDLLLHTGEAEGMRFKGWYAGNKSILNLQIVRDAVNEFDALSGGHVQTFDFLALARAFDESRVASPGLTSWALTNALLEFHLWSSDDEALGGDLAYWYARNRSLGGMSFQAAQQVLGAEVFGSEAQSLRPFSGLQEGLVKLGA